MMILLPLMIGRQVFSPSRWNVITTVVVVKRDYFTEEFMGIDLFRKKYNQMQKYLAESVGSGNRDNVDRIRTRITNDIKSSRINRKDLTEFLYISRTQPELEILFNGIKKFDIQNRSDSKKFHFAEPYMRLLYILSATDHALKLVLVQKEDMFVQSAMSLLILMHRLLIDERYDDMIRVFKLIISKYPEPYQFKRVIETYLDGLIEKNDSESVRLASEVFEILKREASVRKVVRDDSFRKIFYIAITQNNNQLAQEVMPFIEKGKPFFVYNCQIILLCRLERVKEAIELANQLMESPLDKPFAYETFSELEKARYKSSDEKLKEQLKCLLDDMVTSTRRTSPLFLKRFVMTMNLVSRKQAKSLIKFESDS